MPSLSITKIVDKKGRFCFVGMPEPTSSSVDSSGTPTPSLAVPLIRTERSSASSTKPNPSSSRSTDRPTGHDLAWTRALQSQSGEPLESIRPNFWSRLWGRLTGSIEATEGVRISVKQIEEDDLLKNLYTVLNLGSTLRSRTESAIARSTTQTFTVKETIDRRPREDRPEPGGVILVLESCRPENPNHLIGRSVTIRSDAGLDIRVKVAAVRDHETTISLLVAGLNRSVVPVGSKVNIDDDAFKRENSTDGEAISPTFSPS